MYYSDEESESRCEIRYSERLFYNKFLYKIVCKFLHDTPTKLSRLNQCLYDFKGEYKKNIWRTTSIQKQLSRVIIYTNSVTLIDKIVNQFEDSVLILVKPLNNYHSHILKNDEKTIIRKNLFFKKYKFAIRFNRYSMIKSQEGIKKIEENVRNYFIDSSKRIENDYRFTKNYNPVLYLKEKNDLLMVKLMFFEYISRIETVVLFDEIAKMSQKN